MGRFFLCTSMGEKLVCKPTDKPECTSPFPLDFCEELNSITGELLTLSLDFPEHRDELQKPFDMLMELYVRLCGG